MRATTRDQACDNGRQLRTLLEKGAKLLPRSGMTPSTSFGVEVVQLEHGNPIKVGILSAPRDREGARRAATLVFVGVCFAAGLGFAISRLLHKVIYAPAFVAVWLFVGAVVGGYAVRKVRSRLSRYAVGPRLDNDAFVQVAADFDLVTRRGKRFEITLLPGMHGRLENGRAPLPVEALVSDGRRAVFTLDEGGSAEVSVGASQFMIRSRRSLPVPQLPRDWKSPFARFGFLSLQLGLVATLFCLVARPRTIGAVDADDRRGASRLAPGATTPWEAEKWLRVQAQRQAPSLYMCFDALPMACQRAGYVGVGVALSRDGEIRSHWISRSTYGADCPVEKCMSEVVSTWEFDPVPQAMRVILPVQVLRTEKQLAEVRVAERIERSDGEADGRQGSRDGEPR